MEKITEKALFILDKDITDEIVLAVLSALQGFEQDVINKTDGWNKIHTDRPREVDFQMYLVCADTRYTFIFGRCLNKLEKIYSETLHAQLDDVDFTYVANISWAKGKSIAEATNKPLAEAFGIMIASEGKSLPDVTNMIKVFTRGNNLLKVNEVENLSLEERAQAVFDAGGVTGQSSFETYLACALHKPCVEIQHNKNIFKWSNPNYLCITEENDEVLTKATKLCLSDIEELTRMAQGTSIAHAALTSSPA